MSNSNTVTETERLVGLFVKDYREAENVKTTGKMLRTITDTNEEQNEEQMVEFLTNEDVISLFMALLFDVSALHPEHAHLFWHVLNQQYIVCQKRFKTGLCKCSNVPPRRI